LQTPTAGISDPGYNNWSLITDHPPSRNATAPPALAPRRYGRGAGVGALGE